MKIILSVVTFTLALMPAARAEDMPEGKETHITIGDAYIPSGFDSGSEAFAVVTGLFPNSCYRFSEAKIEHVSPTEHVVKAYAKVTEGLCLMVMVPYSKEVQIGRLSVGTHSIKFVNGDGTFWEKSLTIEN